MIVPTGGGKTSVPIVAAKIMRGNRQDKPFAVVVTPFVQLIEDHVSRKYNGVSCTSLMQDVTEDQIEAALNGEFNIVFMTPEKFTRRDIRAQLILKSDQILFIAFDEAHECLSTKYRPAFSNLDMSSDKSIFKSPVIVMSATIRPENEAQIQVFCGQRNVEAIRLSLRRENLIFSKVQMNAKLDKEFKSAERDSIFYDEFKSHFRVDPTSHSTIIFVSSKIAAERIQDVIKRFFLCDFYHSARPEKEKSDAISKFLRKEIHILVATTGCGVGLDLRCQQVIMFGLFANIETIMQLAGRCVRQGILIVD